MINLHRWLNALLSSLGASLFIALCLAATQAPRPLAVIPVPHSFLLRVHSAQVPSLKEGLKGQVRPKRALLSAVADTDKVVVPKPVVVPPKETATLPQAVMPEKPKAALGDTSKVVKKDSVKVVGDTLKYVPRYLDQTKPRLGMLSPYIHKKRANPMAPPIPNGWKHDVKLDSTKNEYIIRDLVGNQQVRYTSRADLGTYLAARRQDLITENFRSLSEKRAEQQQARRRSGFSFNYQIPGGQNSAFTTIFGKPEVDLRITGQADIDAGFERQITDDPSRVNPKRIDPLFKQSIRLGVRGTIGDKLSIDVNWDDKRQFEYENQIRLVYTGYEDEIIKRIEAGNVTLDSRSSLINGGRSLFGIRTDLKLGGVDVSIVASQQKSNGNTLDLEGGAEAEKFSKKIYDYEDDTHFFLGYYFRSHFEEGLSKPPVIITNIREINRIEVWKQNIQVSPDQTNLRQVVALADLAEPKAVLSTPKGEQNTLPDENADQYDTAVLEDLRNGKIAVKDRITNGNVYQEGPFKILREGIDYTVNKALGFLSLTSRLSPDEALAVAFEYTDVDGRLHTVGDLTGSGNSSNGGLTDNRLVLKLLRRQKPQPSDLTWPLTMRNIYRLGASNLQEGSFKLAIEYDKAGQLSSEKIPNLEISGEPNLLEMLGLDRISKSNYNKSDNEVDFGTGTLEERNGRIMFPYLEPFGKRMRDILTGKAYKGTVATGLNVKDFVIDTLYTSQQSVVRTLSQFDIFKISGAASGGVSATYTLGFGVVEGSVRVYSNGNELSPSDYVVNYDFGTVEVLNPAYLQPGNKIRISYDRQQMFAVQQKNLFGMRASYNYQNELMLGATFMRLKEKPNTDKFRIGQEPIANHIWGVDGNYAIRPLWLTRAVDALPLIQTRAESAIDIRGEFARFTPESAQTLAFQRTARDLKDKNRAFAADEADGQISYIDDFEGLKTKFSLAQAGSWRLSSAPDSLDVERIGRSSTNDALLTTWRARMGWFNVGVELFRGTGGATLPKEYASVPALIPLEITNVFPTYDDTGLDANAKALSTLNLFFDPTDRGPYNYTPSLDRFLAPKERKKLWGGMVQRLPEGYTDFSTQNIEFIEFIFQPLTEKAGQDAKLVINLGSISEDILPNARLNTEDGLSTKENAVRSGREILDEWSRQGDGVVNSILAIEDDSNRRTEDLGLDGLSSYDDANYGSLRTKYQNLYQDGSGRVYTEQRYFQAFLDAIDPGKTTSAYRNSAEYQRLWQDALRDPSGDDFHDFRDAAFFTDRDTDKLSRFNYHFGGMELNSPAANQKIVDLQAGSNRLPDTEDLNQNNNLNLDNNYYEYVIPLHVNELERLAEPDETGDYVINKTAEATNGNPAWYKVSIPVRQFTTKVGKIDGFNLIQSIRLWMTGCEDKAQVRFATFDLVGSQWRESKQVGNEIARKETGMVISSLNSEEDAQRYAVPVTAIVQQIRNTTGGSATTRNGREQSMVLSVSNLQAGDQRAVYKTFNEGMDLLKYRNLRMFTHVDGVDEKGHPLRKEEQNYDGLRMFLRLGSDENKNYYEYELPVTPYTLTTGEKPDADKLWQTYQKVGDKTLDLNSMHVVIADMIDLKNFRDNLQTQGGIKAGQTVWSDTLAWDKDLSYLKDLGARLAIKGNPSLSRITSVVVGVRNARSPIKETGALVEGKAKQFQEVNLWVNELRATGYDNLSGWAAIASANIRLADFATISANYNQRTEGFGGLDSQLGGRQGNATQDWGLTTNVNLHKLLPERLGWNMPLTYSIKQGQSTPRFLPDQGDLPLKDKLASIDEDETLDATEKQAQKTALLERAETHNFTRSFSIPITKTNSQSPVVRYLLDPLSLSYRQSEGKSQNPQTREDQNWQWGTAASYSLNLQRVKTLRPFWFIPKEVPVLGGVNKLRLSYLPQSIKAAATVDRDYRSSRQRTRFGEKTEKPDELAYPYRQNHNFGMRRSFDVTYNPFTFLSLSYHNETTQTILNGIDSLFVVKSRSTLKEQTFLNQSDAARALAASNPKDLYVYEKILTRNLQSVFNGVLASPDSTVRADRHSQDFSLSFDPKLDRVKWLDWINIQPITVSTGFDWENGNKTLFDNVGAGVGNSLNVKGGGNMRLETLYRKGKFYQKLKEAEQRDEREARQRREEAQRRRQQAKQDERIRRQQAALKNPKSQAEEGRGGLLGRKKKSTKADSTATATLTPAPLPPPTPKPSVPADTSKAKKKGVGLPVNSQKILRWAALRLFSITDLSFNYTKNDAAQSSNITKGYYLFGNNILPWDYRFGLSSSLPNDYRLNNGQLQISDNLRSSTQYDGRGTLALTRELRVDLTGNVTFEESNRVSYRFKPAEEIWQTDANQTGRARVTVWALGAAFGNMVIDQYEAFDALRKANPGKTSFEVTEGSRPVMTNESVTESFRKSFLTGMSKNAFGGRAYLPVPLPNWSISYNGLQRIPFLSRFVQSASIRHGYNTTYEADFRNVAREGEKQQVSFVGKDATGKDVSYQISYILPAQEIGSVRVNERFSPLVEFDFVGKRGIQTNLKWDKANSYTFSSTNFDLAKNSTNEFTFRASYSKTGLVLPFKLPFMKSQKLNNTIRFGLSVSYRQNDETSYSLKQGLEQLLKYESETTSKGGTLNFGGITYESKNARQQNVVDVEPRLSYQISPRVGLDGYMTYSNRFGTGRLEPNLSTLRGGFNVRVSISN